MLGAGKLDHYMTLQKPESVDHPETNEEIAEYADFAHVWAGFDPLRGNNVLIADQAQSRQTAFITIRWRGDINEHFRLFDPETDKHYYILSYQVVGHEKIELVCTTVDSNEAR